MARIYRAASYLLRARRVLVFSSLAASMRSSSRGIGDSGSNPFDGLLYRDLFKPAGPSRPRATTAARPRPSRTQP